MKRSVFSFVLVVLLAACTKHHDQADNSGRCSNYVPGQVVIGTDSTASLDQVFAMVNANGLDIAQAVGYYYTSPYPKDSIPGIIAYLNSKPYILANGFSAGPGNVFAHYQTGVVHVDVVFWNMTPENQRDWTNSQQLLQLSRITANSYAYMILTVPEGNENFWAKKLKGSPLVTSAELNCRMEIALFN